jgi:hypothetical protein
LPEHLAADEKHTRIKGENAYGVFKDEAQCLDQDYSPKSVNTDGWKATIKAWKNLFPSIAILCCFLHLFLKMRDRCSEKYKDLFPQVAHKFKLLISFGIAIRPQANVLSHNKLGDSMNGR